MQVQQDLISGRRSRTGLRLSHGGGDIVTFSLVSSGSPRMIHFEERDRKSGVNLQEGEKQTLGDIPLERYNAWALILRPEVKRNSTAGCAELVQYFFLQ